MSNDNSSAPQKSLPDRLARFGFLKWLLLPVAIVIVPLYDLGKELSGKVYSGHGWFDFGAWFRCLIGFALASAGAFLTFVGLGGTLSLSWLIWLPSAAIVWLLLYFIGYPALHLSVFKPLETALGDLFEDVRKAAKKHAEPFFGGLVGIATHLPGSRPLWNGVEDEKSKGQWVKGFMGFLSVLAVLGLGGGLAYKTYHLLAGFIPAGWLWGYAPPVAAGFAAAVLAIVVVVSLFIVMEAATLHFVGTTLAAGVVYGAFPCTKALLATLGLNQHLVWVLLPAEFLLALAYVYPGLHCLLKTNIIKKVLDGLKWLVTHTYSDDNRDYRKFFGQASNIVAALLSGGLAFWAFAYWGIFPVVVPILFGVLAVLCAYLEPDEIFDESAAAVLWGLILSAAAAIATYVYLPEGGTLAVWLGWTTLHLTLGAKLFWSAVVGSALVTFLLLFTGFYQLVRAATVKRLAKPAGLALEKWHADAKSGARKVKDWWRKHLIKPSLDDDSDYGKFFAHAATLIILGLGVWKSLALVTGPYYWLIGAGLGVLSFVAYMILGRLLQKGGVSAVAFIVGFGTFAHGTWQLYSIEHHKWWLAALDAFSAAWLITLVVLPPAYLVLKFFADPLSRWFRIAWLVQTVFDFFWSYFEVFEKWLISFCKWVDEWVIKPVVSAWKWFRSTLKELWDSIRGKK